MKKNNLSFILITILFVLFFVSAIGLCFYKIGKDSVSFNGSSEEVVFEVEVDYEEIEEPMGDDVNESDYNGDVESNEYLSNNTEYSSEFTDMYGLLIEFDATDLEGNILTESILEESSLTMVTVWATYSDSSIQEIATMAVLSSDYEDEDIQFIGAVIDVYNSDGTINLDKISDAITIVDELGIDYPQLIPSEDMMTGLFSTITSVPVTFFVDSDGYQVGTFYIGARDYSDWNYIIFSELYGNF